MNDQFPSEVLERRNDLRNKASLVGDKLYVNNKLTE